MCPLRSFDIIVAGAGPGGAMAAYLLAKEGFTVCLMEKETRSRKVARGEFIQPPTGELLQKLGLLEECIGRGLQKIRYLAVRSGTETIMEQDYEQLNRPVRFVLTGHHHIIRDLLREKFTAEPGAELWMGTTVTELLHEGSAVTGVRCVKDGEELEVRARLTIAADGRGSTIRRLLQPGVPLRREYPSDLCVIELPKPKEGWPAAAAIHMHAQPYPIAVQPLDESHVRVAVYIPKGSFKAFRERGVRELLSHVCRLFPDLKEPAAHVTDWDQCGLSSFSFWTEHVDQYAWDGVLLMGDSAHTVSPMAGMGQQLALLDAAALVPYVCSAFDANDWSRLAFVPYEQERMKFNAQFIEFDLQSNQLNFIHKPWAVRLHHSMIRRVGKIPSLMQRGLELGAGYPVPELTRKQKLQALGLLPAWI